MAEILKRTYWMDQDGRRCGKGTLGAVKHKAAVWSIRMYIDGRRKLVKGYTDKGATMQLAARLEARKARGEMGLIDPYETHAKRPLVEHVADWTAELKQLGRDDVYAGQCDMRVRRLADECGWDKLADIDADSFCAWRATADSRAAHNRHDQTSRAVVHISPRTANHYLLALKTFCRWCMKRKRLKVDPTTDIGKVDETADVRRARRASGQTHL